jgi:hypothetical protein
MKRKKETEAAPEEVASSTLQVEATEVAVNTEVAVRPEATKPEEKKEDLKSDISDLEVARKMLKISQSANDRKLEFNLSFETVKKLLSFKNCYYTGKMFKEEEGHLMSRSFDRIDSLKGYVEGNVVACTVDINGKKSNLSIEEISCLYNKLVKKRKD